MRVRSFSLIQVLALSVSALGNLSIAVFAGIGLRGSDQYWYAANLVMVKAGRGFVSNSLFPSAYLPLAPGSEASLPPFVHNIPVSYLAVGLNQIIADPYFSWLTLNTALCFGSALILYSVAFRLWGANWATFVASVTLLFPHSIWFGLNALSEQFIMFLVSLLFWAILRAAESQGRYVWLASLCVSVLALSRDSHILLFFALAVYMLMLKKWGRSSNLNLSVSIFLLLSIYVPLKSLMPSYPNGGILATISVGTETALQKFSNMSPFYDPSFVAPISEIAAKFLKNFAYALLPQTPMEVLIETLPIFLLLVGVLTAPRTETRLAINFWAISLFATYLAMSVIFQAQSRYAVIFVPFAIVYGAMIMRSWAGRRNPTAKAVIAAGVLSGLVLSSAAMGLYYRTSAGVDAQDMREIARSFSKAPISYTLLVDVEIDATLKIGYAVAPSTVIIFDSKNRQDCLSPDVLDNRKITSIVGPPNMTKTSLDGLFCSPRARAWQYTVLQIGGETYHHFR
jgi:hypothetical protein